MANFVQLFTSYMDQQGIKYSMLKDYAVKVVYTGDNLRSIPIIVFFDEDGDTDVQLKCWEIANCKGKEGAGIFTCNQVNKKFRWIKFYLDKDSDIVADMDAVVDEVTCGAECVELVRRMVNIIDDAYPSFAQIIFSN